MPQIWMTYDEFADLLETGAEQAYERGLEERLDCKISRDGQRRIKLNDALAGLFLDRNGAQRAPLDGAIDDLRNIHGLMTKYEEPAISQRRTVQRKFGGAW